MKRVIVCLLMLIFVLSMVGCGNGNHPEFLTTPEHWYFFDEVTGENEKMSFREDGSFYWGCECGEPVGASDCYELYEYDEGTGTIRLYNGYDDTELVMEVLDYSDYHLLLRIEGEIKDYTYIDYDYDADVLGEDRETYMEDYSMVASIVEGSAEEAVLTHYNYDGDVEYPENTRKAYPLADDVKFYDLQVFTHYRDGKLVENKTTYRELPKEEAVEYLASNSGFIWFNNNMEIEKITYYGAIEYQD